MTQDNEKVLWHAFGEGKVILLRELRKKSFSNSFQPWIVGVGPIVHSLLFFSTSPRKIT